MTFLPTIALRNKMLTHSFLPSFDNANDRLCQEEIQNTMVTWRHTSPLHFTCRILHGKCASTVLSSELLNPNEWDFWCKGMGNKCVNAAQSALLYTYPDIFLSAFCFRFVKSFSNAKIKVTATHLEMIKKQSILVKTCGKNYNEGKDMMQLIQELMFTFCSEWKWMNLSKMTGRFEYKQKTMAPIKCTHDFFPFRAKNIVRSSDCLELIDIWK